MNFGTSKWIFLFTLLVYVSGVCADIFKSSRQAKVAIIGAGIGGASTSFFVQKFLEEQRFQSANITVFERNDYIGGRLKHIIFGPDRLVVEVGGAAWANDNHWMAYMAKELKINVTNGNSQNEKISEFKVWQGNGFSPVFQLLKDDQPMTSTVLETEAEFLKNINSNYHQQITEEPFTTINMFLKFGDMIKYSCETIMSFFVARNVSAEYVETELIPVNRAIYNQGSDANSFSLLASLDAILSQNAVDEGNSHMVEVMFESAKAQVLLSTTVTKVTKTDQGKYTMSIETKESEKTNADELEDFDVVFIAAPIEQSGLQFVNIDIPRGTYWISNIPIVPL
jgi:protoporphyrinogen oxidase